MCMQVNKTPNQWKTPTDSICTCAYCLCTSLFTFLSYCFLYFVFLTLEVFFAAFRAESKGTMSLYREMCFYNCAFDIKQLKSQAGRKIYNHLNKHSHTFIQYTCSPLAQTDIKRQMLTTCVSQRHWFCGWQLFGISWTKTVIMSARAEQRHLLF